jgi:hypothetical protein
MAETATTESGFEAFIAKVESFLSWLLAFVQKIVNVFSTLAPVIAAGIAASRA